MMSDMSSDMSPDISSARFRAVLHPTSHHVSYRQQKDVLEKNDEMDA